MASKHVDEFKATTNTSEQHLENGSIHSGLDVGMERKVLKKVDAFLMPMLSFLLLVAFLDRTNIGNARIQGLEKDLNMHGNQYNIALFIFFIPYMILDIPANIMMKRLRPSYYLPCLMFCWGKYPAYTTRSYHLMRFRNCHHRRGVDPKLRWPRRLSRSTRCSRGRLLSGRHLPARHVLYTLRTAEKIGILLLG